jgi:hypothetical protein
MQNEKNNTSSLNFFPPILIHSTTLIIWVLQADPGRKGEVPGQLQGGQEQQGRSATGD